MRLVLYTRGGCHLCERLEALVAPTVARLRERRRDAEFLTIDVDGDENWRNLYGDRVPVLTRDGDVIVEGNPDAGEVERALRAL